MKRKIALSIAGSDSSGGAGIQADLKTFASLGVYGVTVITCITAQNTQQVKRIHKLPIDIIEKQFDVLVEDLNIDAVKTGMLYDMKIIKCIGMKLKKNNMKSVVDPVMVATTGEPLIEKNFVKAIKKDLIPYSYIITPNINEAQVLSKMNIKTIDDIKEACRIIFELGSQNVLITGGHFEGDNSKDVFFNGKKFNIFSLPKITDNKFHGSGCTFSSLITGFLALGKRPIKAVELSKNIIWNMIFYGYRIGKGSFVLNNSFNISKDSLYSIPTKDYFNTWFELKKLVDSLVPMIPLKYIPEVGMNIGYAIKNAKKYTDICAIEGRIVKTQLGAIRCGRICFCSSKHIASIILAAMSFNHEYRCALNIKYSKDNIQQFKKAGFMIGSFNRKYEPSAVSTTMEWGTKEVIKQLNQIPDVIYDRGSIGKEPMIRILGKNPKNIFDKLNVILKS